MGTARRGRRPNAARRLARARPCIDYPLSNCKLPAARPLRPRARREALKTRGSPALRAGTDPARAGHRDRPHSPVICVATNRCAASFDSRPCCSISRRRTRARRAALPAAALPDPQPRRWLGRSGARGAAASRLQKRSRRRPCLFAQTFLRWGRPPPAPPRRPAQQAQRGGRRGLPRSSGRGPAQGGPLSRARTRIQ
ncbi:MAG: hypothetical protein J3K34DRAFT_439878 [Monoraphidium minutum]|nr:MAG: hypothetical protein J3K34DRAFT_439878 [Monoraphidium minutum]